MELLNINNITSYIIYHASQIRERIKNNNSN